MQKLASQFQNISVVTSQERIVLGPLVDIIIDPANGNAVGILFKSIHGNMVTNTRDIIGVGLNFIMIEGIEKASEPDEIIRIKEIMDQEVELVGSRVVDETGRNLGQVNDWCVNLKTMRLARLHVTSSKLFKFIRDDLIISIDDIITIEKGKITVKSGLVKSGKKISNLVKEGKPVRTKAAPMKMDNK